MINFFNKHKRLSTTIILTFFILAGCFVFPVYNMAHKESAMVLLINLIATMFLYNMLGRFESGLMARNTMFSVLMFNIIMAVSSVGCRYALEYGKIVTYNIFTPSNIILHLAIAVSVSTISWLLKTEKR